MKLEQLIRPMPVAQFVRDHFETTPLLVKGPPSRFSDFFGQDDFFRLAQDPRVGMIRCTFPDRDDKMVGKVGRFPLLEIKARGVEDAIAAGATVWLDDLQRADERIGALCETLKKEIAFPCTFRAASWLSPASGGVPFHCEGACTFLFQIAGTKTWRLSKRPALPHPLNLARLLADGSIVFDRHEVDEWETNLRPLAEHDIVEYKVEPGDLLFVPSGCWHSTSASDGESTLSVNLYAEPVKFLDVLMAAVRPILQKSVDWRRIPALEEAPGEGVPPALERYFADALTQLAGVLRDMSPHAPALEREWKLRLAESDALVPRYEGEVEPADRLRLTPPVTFMVERSLDKVTQVNVFLRGQEATFDEEDLLPFVFRVLEGKAFVAKDAADWAPRCTWDEIKGQLDGLLANGFLERVASSVEPAAE